MPKRRLPILTALALGFIAICIIVIGAWDIFPGARSQTLATQDQASAAELSAAIETQRQVAAKLTRSASFDQRFRKLSEKAQKSGTVPVIVKVRAAFRPEGQISNAAEALAQRKVIEEAQDRLLVGLRYEPSSLKKYNDVPYVAIITDTYGLAQLQSSADVMDMFGDIPMKLATGESLPQIKATRAWRAGYTGADKTIVILDSGVDKTHPDLSNKVVAEACFSTNNSTIGYESLCPGNATSSTAENSGKNCEKAELSGVDGCGHGTHIAGIAAGSKGVAVNADVISIQVMSYVTGEECGFGTCLRSRTSDVMDALQHVFDNLRNSHDIAAVNISLVTDITGVYETPCDAGDGAPLKDKIDQLRSVGIATVVGAGNDGFTNALGYPACISTSISVGAVGDGGGGVPADAVWQDSNSASYLSLLAPGIEIRSAIPGGLETGAAGTSQAAAHVSGAWAILKQREPGMSVDDALNRFKITGELITDARNGRASRRIQVDKALNVDVPEDMWLGLYYDNPNLANNPVATLDDGDGFIDRNFSGASPAEGIGAENYSIRWIRTLTLTQGTWRFSVTGDDGVRLWINDQLKINEWRNQSATTFNVAVPLDAGNHEVRLEYYQATDTAHIRLIWGIDNPICLQAVAADHWRGEYFNNMNLAGNSSMVRDEGAGALNPDWADGSPSSTCNVFTDRFSAVWTRTVNFLPAQYRFTVTNLDDGVRLYLGGQLIINRWFDGSGTHSVDVDLSVSGGGNRVVKLEFYENGGLARANVSWAPLLPAPPSNLWHFNPSFSHINLSWTDNSSFESGFKIERWNGSSWSHIATVGANATTYTDPGLAPLTTYFYRVRAYNSAGDSGPSNEIGATTLTPPPPPSAPYNLAAIPQSTSQINVYWVDSSGDESGFIIERRDGDYIYLQIATVGPNATMYADTGLYPSTTYTYRVRAFNNNGYSGYSNESSSKPLSPCQSGSCSFDSDCQQGQHCSGGCCAGGSSSRLETPHRNIGGRKIASLIFLSSVLLSGVFLARRFSVRRPKR